MALKTMLESLDDVPEAIQEHYKEYDQSGATVYILDIEDVDTHPTVANLKSAFERVKADRKTLNDQVKELEGKTKLIPEDFDPDEWERLKAGHKEADPDADRKNSEKLRAQIEKRLDEERVKPLTERNEKLERFLERRLLDDDLTRELIENGISKKFLAAARALLKEKRIFKQIEGDDDFRIVADTDMGEMELAKYVKDWAGTDEGKTFVEEPRGTGAQGSSNRGATVNNPFAKDTLNMTEQGRVIREDRGKAEKLMRQAGYSESRIAQVMSG